MFMLILWIFVIVIADLIIEGIQRLERGENPIPAEYTFVKGEERKIKFPRHRPFDNKHCAIVEHVGVFEISGQSVQLPYARPNKEFDRLCDLERLVKENKVNELNKQQMEEEFLEELRKKEKANQGAEDPETQQKPSGSEKTKKGEKEPTYFQKVKGFGKTEMKEIKNPNFSENEYHSKIMNYERDEKRKKSLILIEHALAAERIKQAHCNSKRKKNLTLPYWENALQKKLAKLEQQKNKKIRALEKCYEKLNDFCKRKLARIEAIIKKDEAAAIAFIPIPRSRKETRIAGEN